jgi:hypothetical protein
MTGCICDSLQTILRKIMLYLLFVICPVNDCGLMNVRKTDSVNEYKKIRMKGGGGSHVIRVSLVCVGDLGAGSEAELSEHSRQIPSSDKFFLDTSLDILILASSHAFRRFACPPAS